VHQGLVWLALVDLRRAWPRSGLVALAIAPAIVAAAFGLAGVLSRRGASSAELNPAGEDFSGRSLLTEGSPATSGGQEIFYAVRNGR